MRNYYIHFEKSATLSVDAETPEDALKCALARLVIEDKGEVEE